MLLTVDRMISCRVRKSKIHYSVYKSYRFLSRGIVIQSTASHLMSLRFVLILYCHQRLGLPSGLLSSTIEMVFGEWYKLRNSSLCNFLQSLVTSSVFVPDIFLSALFSDILNLCSCLNVRETKFHATFRI